MFCLYDAKLGKKACTSKVLTLSFFLLFSDHDLDDLEMQVVRYKPEGLDALCRNTKFSRKELQVMYRGFKQVCTISIYDIASFLSWHSVDRRSKWWCHPVKTPMATFIKCIVYVLLILNRKLLCTKSIQMFYMYFITQRTIEMVLQWLILKVWCNTSQLISRFWEAKSMGDHGQLPFKNRKACQNQMLHRVITNTQSVPPGSECT